MKKFREQGLIKNKPDTPADVPSAVKEWAPSPQKEVERWKTEGLKGTRKRDEWAKKEFGLGSAKYVEVKKLLD